MEEKESIPKLPPKKLVYYTNGNALLESIALNRIRLHAYHINFVNEVGEYERALEIFKEEFKKSGLDESLLDGLDEQKADTFIIQFEEKKDDLNCWRKYKSGTLDFSLDLDAYCFFDYENDQTLFDFYFNKTIEKAEGNKSNEIIGIARKCIYSEKIAHKICKQIIDSVEGYDEAVPDMKGKFIAECFRQFAAFFRFPKFSSGNEIRFAIFTYKKIEHEFKNGYIVPYINYDFDKSSKKSIKEIVIGPCADRTMAKYSAKKFVKDSGLKNFSGDDVPVRNSAFPHTSLL